MGKLGKRLAIVILAVFASLLTVAATGFTTKAKAADIILDGETFEIADKVSLKLNEDGGMRWILRVSDNVYNYVKDTNGVEMGFVIAPKALMDKATDGDYYGMAQKILIPIDIAKGYQDTGTADTDWYFNGCVVKMNDVNRKYDYTAAAYIKSGDTVLKQTAINTNSVNNFYNVANKSILYSGEDYSEKMLGLKSYNWLGTEEFPIKVETADQYNSLVGKINAERDFSAKIIEIGKSVDRSGATLNDGYALPAGTREVCDGDAHVYTDGRCVNCNKLQTVGVQYLENAGVYYVAGYTGHDKEVYVLSEYNGKPVTFVKNSAFIDNRVITKVVFPESVKRLDGSVFQGCLNLEYVSMTGVEELTSENLSNSGIYGSEVFSTNNFLNCEKLKVVIVGKKFKITDNHFIRHDESLAAGLADIYMSGTKAECEFIYNPADRNEHLSGVVYYQGDLSRCQEWKFNADGTISTSAKSHNYVDNKCVNCGDYETHGVSYLYDEAKECYYVGDNKSLNVSVVKILAKYNDGMHGEKDVTYVKNSAFIDNRVITKVILPDSVKSLDGGVFQGCSNLEYVSMTGIENLDYNGSELGYGTDRGNNFMNCTALKYVILSPAFTTNCQQFFLNGGNPEKAILDIYVNAASGTPNFGGANTNLLTGNIYHRVDDTATVKCLQWKYGADGEIVKGASSHIFVDGICSECGEKDAMGVIYKYNDTKKVYYVAGYTGTSSIVNVFDTWNDGKNDEKPVKFVGFEAFRNKTITKVILPESVDSLEGRVFWGCENLEYVSMAGVTNLKYASPYGGERNNNFRNCFKLKTVIVSNALYSDVGQFGCAPTDPGNKKILDFYVVGSSGAPSLDYETADANNLCSGKVYYYSETEVSGCWHYDEGGMPILWN